MSLQVYAVNNFGTGLPGVKEFLIPKGSFSNISRISVHAIIVRSHFIYYSTISFLSGNGEKYLPLTFIAAASGGGAFVLIIVAVICFAFVVRGRR